MNQAWSVLKTVYQEPLSWVISIIAAALTFTFIVVLPSYATMAAVLLSPVVSVFSKAAFFLTLYGSIGTNFPPLAASSVIIISLLFGLNAALLTHYIRRARNRTSAAGTASKTTLGGLVAALFGIGCAACGSAVILFVLKLVGAVWIVSYLPFHGAEFALIGVALLLYVTYSLIKKISDPLMCPS